VSRVRRAARRASRGRALLRRGLPGEQVAAASEGSPAPLTPSGDVDDWRDLAACRAAVERGDAVMDDWFPSRDGSDYRVARPICTRCPVRLRCLDEAMAVEGLTLADRHDMVGGCSPNERNAIARQRRSVYVG
jgi:Transcription factor WhiB